ncbi:MAG: DNA repair protein RadC [Candidatus Omnitrophica bacterium]|nr:DNA repair protein RadC [Candidatus Omnitrophota bacterium]
MKHLSKTFKVSDLPVDERPRERMQRLGPEALSTHELLAIIFASGTKGMPVTVAAQTLMTHFGSLSKIAEASDDEIKSMVRGIGTAKILRLRACFEIARRIENERKYENDLTRSPKITNPLQAYEMIKKKLRVYKKEHFFVVSLNSRNKIIGIDEISTGTLEASIVHPRETFESAIRHHAAKIIIAHNHPSDDPEPSEDDISITRRLKEAGLIMGIELIDHIVVCKSCFFSFKEKGFL